MMLQILLLATCVSFALSHEASSNIFSDCPPDFIHTPTNVLLTVKHLEVVGCSQQPCIFTKTANFEVYGLIVAQFTSPSISFVITAVTPLGPLDLFKSNDLNTYFHPSKDFEPEMEIAVKIKSRINAFIPAFKGTARFSLLDTSDKSLFCAQINVTIKEVPLTRTLGMEDLSDGLFGGMFRKK